MMQANEVRKSDMRSPWGQGGEALARLRIARQITVAELVEQADLPSISWMADVEAGRRPVPSAFFAPLAREYDLPLRDFAALCLSFYDAKAYHALFGGAQIAALKAAA